MPFFCCNIFEKFLQISLIFAKLYLKLDISLYHFCLFTYNIFKSFISKLLIKSLSISLYQFKTAKISNLGFDFLIISLIICFLSNIIIRYYYFGVILDQIFLKQV